MSDRKPYRHRFPPSVIGHALRLYYRRYDVPGAAPQYFWGRWGHRDDVSFKSGQVTLKGPA